MEDNHVDSEFLDQPLRVWQPLSDNPLDEDGARESIANISGFFDLLAEWVADDNKKVRLRENTTIITSKQTLPTVPRTYQRQRVSTYEPSRVGTDRA